MLETLLIVCAILFFNGCGNTEDDYKAQPVPVTPVAADPDFAAVKPTVDRVCVKCHDGTKQKPDLRTPAAFKKPAVLAAIESGKMPPGGNISSDDKAQLVAYLRK